MIKVYFDWNVISQMKNGYHEELKNIVFNTDKLFKPFSTSHIGDILSSYNESEKQILHIESDLEYLAKYSNNLCLFNNGKEIVLDYSSPKELFEQRIEEKEIFSDLSLSGLSKIFDEYEPIEGFGKHFTNLLSSIPFDEVFLQALNNSQQLQSLFPGLKENPTMEGFFDCFNKILKGLNEEEDYKELRKTVQTGIGINRDRVFDSKSPFNQIEKEYKKYNFTLDSHANISKNIPQWFNEITNAYLFLDMHGYQEDNVNTKNGRKETFKNTTEDAFHCAFASMCNFYVINDNKSYKKAKQVFEKLNINTCVLKPNEFVEYYNNYLNLSDRILNLLIPFNLIKNGEYFEDNLDGAILRTYILPYFIFDYFNKILVLLPDNSTEFTILLSQNEPTNSKKTYLMEIERLVAEISKLLGPDIEELGKINKEELSQENWIGRKWKFEDSIYRLVRINGHFQLYFDLK